MNQKTHKYTLGKLEERKPQTIGDSSNNDREGTQKSSIKKDFYKNFIKITGKYMCQILFFNKVLGLLHHRYFPVKFEKILRTLFFSEHLWWLLLSDVTKYKNEHLQYKNESKMKQNTYSKLF